MFALLRQVADAWRRHQALHELGRLSDYYLADIGLRREELPMLGTRLPRNRVPRFAPVPALRAELGFCG